MAGVAPATSPTPPPSVVGQLNPTEDETDKSPRFAATSSGDSSTEGRPTDSVGAGEDFALSRVPAAQRFSWWAMALEQFSSCGCISQVLLGAILGSRMPLWSAALACIVGALILGLLSVAVGCMGSREGLATAVLCRWAGFGGSGAAVLSVVIGVSSVSWFGIQAAIAGEGLERLLGGPPVWGWSLLCGAVIVVVSTLGFQWMVTVAWVTGPAFLIATTFAVVRSLADHSFADLAVVQPAGDPLTMSNGIGLVVGGFVVGAAVSADVFRFGRSAGDVALAVFLGRVPALLLYTLAGVVLALAHGTADIVELMLLSTGWEGVVILVAGEIVINSTNLYGVGLAVVAFCDTALRVRLPRQGVTVVCGALGSALAAMGVLAHFMGFLGVLAVAFPPVAGIALCEYWLVRAFGAELSKSRGAGVLPPSAPSWLPATLVVWVSASLFGWFVKVGIPCLQSLFCAAALYYLAWRVGALRPVGVTYTETAPQQLEKGQP